MKLKVRKKKSKQEPEPKLSAYVSVLQNGLNNLSGVIRSLAPLAIPFSELWEMINDLGMKDDMGASAFLSLSKNCGFYNCFIALSTNKRKEFLFKQLNGHN